MIRIEEKMLITKEMKPQHSLGTSIGKTLASEEESYKKMIKDLLSEKKFIEFKVSDMLRGKCIFSNLDEILMALKKN